jgi:hypothetical protein
MGADRGPAGAPLSHTIVVSLTDAVRLARATDLDHQFGPVDRMTSGSDKPAIICDQDHVWHKTSISSCGSLVLTHVSGGLCLWNA